ncbi:MAG: penicillin acylase family protein [Rhodothermales bacterium]|nr:penicillin acylase family protein [Rhodothermales bacterium]
MRRSVFPRALSGWLLLLLLLAAEVQAQTATDTLRMPGLHAPVEILRDPWGIAHIYAENEADLFFAQGYSAARDRLFQFEIWRRQATGTVAEILGPRAIERDAGTRLFLFRGDMEAEMNYYHPRGAAIIRAYVRGVNAYIAEAMRSPDTLPLEFHLLGITPHPWTPAVVISRHQGLLGNINDELDYGRAVALLGPDAVRELVHFHPGEPRLALDPALDADALFDDILGRYNAFRRPIRFEPDDIAAAHRNDPAAFEHLARAAEAAAHRLHRHEREAIGSNNWVVSGRLTQSGYPVMANDPHRVHAAPSLRYWVHLVAPGWNVIGGGEPEIPGVSIGHNEHGAWGLTVFPTDGEDLYVYDTHPDDPRRYRYGDGWEAMRVLQDTIRVKGQAPVVVDLAYTRHGPVVYEDAARRKAYAVRAAWMEIGGAPYLASLRMNQATTWEEFREACSFSHIPGENMVWAGRDGTIGWQAVGIAPIRPNWDGLVPVPGDGRYEWAGYLPIKEKPHVVNPDQGFWATANENLVPPGYPHRNAVGWNWSDPYRAHRLAEVLGSGRRLSMMDMMRLQTDYLSLPARNLVPLLHALRADDPAVEHARRRLLEWDFVLDAESVAAGIYVAWERRLMEHTHRLFVPEAARDALGRIAMSTMIGWLTAPPPAFGPDPVAGRDAFLLQALAEAIADLTAKLGPDPGGWQYGQERYKHALIRHPLSAAVAEPVRQRLDAGPVPRGGNSYTVGNTGWGDNQTSGASFRLIVDTADWDAAVGMNAPGQSGNPDDPHYRDLFPLWAQDGFFPVYFSRGRVEAAARHRAVLMPANPEK